MSKRLQDTPAEEPDGGNPHHRFREGPRQSDQPGLLNKADIRASDLYREINTVNAALRQPGTGQISDAAEVHVSPDGTQAVFAGAILDKLEGTPPTRIAATDLVTGDTQVLTFGPNVDRLPKFSPDGRQIAFLSDRRGSGDFQLYLLDPVSGRRAGDPSRRGLGGIPALVA